MEKFIYVFTPEDRDTLIKSGYTILPSNMQGVYVFLNDGELHFDRGAIATFALSDVLTL